MLRVFDHTKHFNSIAIRCKRFFSAYLKYNRSDERPLTFRRDYTAENDLVRV